VDLKRWRVSRLNLKRWRVLWTLRDDSAVQLVSITKIGWLMLCKEIFVYSENHMKHNIHSVGKTHSSRSQR
jgi:hypothetical protein